MSRKLSNIFASLRGGGGTGLLDPPPASLAAFRDRESVGRILEQQEGAEGKDGRGWLVTIIRAGRSLNGLTYGPGALQEAAPLFEGVPVYAYRWGDQINHLSDEAKAGMPRGASANLVGKVVKAWWSEEEQAIKGYLAVHDQPTRTLLKNAYSAGDIGAGVESPLLGLSIDAEGLKEGVDKSDVSKIIRASSLDIVTKPAAGGEFDRIMEQEADVKFEEQLEKLKGELQAAMQAEIKGLKEAFGPPATPPAAPGAAPPAASPVQALREFLEKLPEEDRAKAAAEVVGLLKELGLQAAEAPEVDKFQKLAAGVQGLMEAKDVKSMRKGLGSLLEELVGAPDQEQDEKDRRIAALESTLRRAALERTMAPLMESVEVEVDGKPRKGRLRDADTVLKLVSMDGVRFVEEDGGYKVEGLKEAVQELVAAKPFLVDLKEEDPAPAKGKGKDTEAAGEKKTPSSDRQTFRLTEEHADDGPMKRLEQEITRRSGLLAEGNLDAITEIRNLRLQLQQG